MGIWKELHSKRGVSETASGVNPTRGWHVRGSTPDAARSEPEAPHRGDTHPDDPFLAINQVIYAPTGFGTEVTAQYVPVEFLDPTPPEDTTGDDWFPIDTDHEDEDVDIPVFQLVTKKIPDGSGSVIEKSVWGRVANTIPFRKTLVVHRLQVNATVVSDPGVLAQFSITDLIKAQHNKIHTIFGRKMLFRAGGTKRIKKDKYQFNYEWVEDPGIPYTLGALPTEGTLPGVMVKVGSEAFPIHDQLHVIKPFMRIDTAPNPDDPEALPIVHVSPAYEEDPNGHLTLPGIG